MESPRRLCDGMVAVAAGAARLSFDVLAIENCKLQVVFERTSCTAQSQRSGLLKQHARCCRRYESESEK